MDSIPMLDLGPQHAPLAEALRGAAARVIASGRFILGGEVAAFEREVASRLGVEAAIGVSSGSDALVSMLLAAGVGAGDEVVTTPYSFFATVEAIVRVGARPVFADVDPDTLNLDPARASEKLGPRTRAVLVVHLFGRVARTDGLRAACHRHGVALLEDAAQAIGARDGSHPGGRAAGAIGRGAALSFFPSKNLGGLGDGGMVLTNDGAFAATVRRIRSHGADEKLRHEVVGGNFRLDELQAAFLRVKLPHLEAWTDDRRRLAAAYRARLAGLPIGLPPADEGCVWNQYVIRVPGERRAALIALLAERRIASAIFYSIPLHLQPALRGLGHRAGDFPVAERAAQESLALPLFPGLGLPAVDRVVDAIAAACR
jgi:dTDP-4-amino-4,6-dideoxygalactose transaminase